MTYNENIRNTRFEAAGLIKDGMRYSQRVFHHTYACQSEDVQFLEFRLLQRLNLVQLQNELARHKAAIWEGMEASEEELKAVRGTLHDYGKPT